MQIQDKSTSSKLLVQIEDIGYTKQNAMRNVFPSLAAQEILEILLVSKEGMNYYEEVHVAPIKT